MIETTVSLKRIIVSVFVHYFTVQHRYVLYFHEFLRLFRIALHYVVETHYCRQFVAVDNAQLSAFAEFAKGTAGWFLGSFPRSNRACSTNSDTSGRRLLTGRCISMMPRDKIDSNDAKLEWSLSSIYDIYNRVNRAITKSTSRTFPSFIVQSDSLTAFTSTVFFILP